MFEKIKRASKFVVDALAAYLLRLYVVLASLYVLAVVAAAIAISVLFPPIIPVAIAAAVAALALGALVHFALASVVNLFSRTATPGSSKIASAVDSHSSTNQINSELGSTSAATRAPTVVATAVPDANVAATRASAFDRFFLPRAIATTPENATVWTLSI